VNRILPALALLALLPGSAAAAVEPVTPGADGPSGAAAASSTGRYVAFASEAANLVPGDTNGSPDVFVRDRVTGVTERVSVAAGGGQANGTSGAPSISGDGRIVAFASRATNLGGADANGAGLDVFVHDRLTGRTTRLHAPGGLSQAFDPDVAAGGRHVAFSAERVTRNEEGDLQEAGPRRVYVAVLTSGAVSRVSVSSRERPAEGESGAASISADGRYVAFDSTAANLVAGDRNRRQDVFVRDRRRGTTVRASISSRGRGASDNSYEPALSDDGRHVAFTSRARDLAPRDEDRATDIYVRDLDRRHTRRVSRGSAGRSLTGWATAPSISADGDLVAFQLSRTDLVEQGSGPVGEVLVRKRSARATVAPPRLAGGPGRRSGFPALSADGRFVAFTSADADFAAGDVNGSADVFVAGPLR